ncbi:hypothetical protein LTR17_021820 [Elasticomyces elasticus]|nr:hypothetical protein LTR17_021820 [Elasticomyces elasticus]
MDVLRRRQDSLGCETGAQLTISDGSVFGIACNAAYYANGPARPVSFTSIDDCIGNCTDPSCIAVFGDPSHCYLLSGLLGYASVEPSVGAFAVLNIQPAEGRRVPPVVNSPTVTTFSTLPTPSTLVSDLGTGGQASITIDSSQVQTSSSSTSSSTTTTPLPSIPSTTTSTPTSSATSTAPSQEEKPGGLSTGAKAGIGVGAAIIGLAIILGIGYLGFRMGKTSYARVAQHLPPIKRDSSADIVELEGTRERAELHGEHRPYEAGGGQLYEVDGGGRLR